MEQYGPYALQALIAFSTALGGVKVGLNGLEKRMKDGFEAQEKRVDKIETKVDSIIDSGSDRNSRIAVLEDRHDRSEVSG